MNLYPLYLKLRGVPCLVVGGGSVALRKVTALLASGARVTVVSPELCAGLERLVRHKRIRSKRQCYRRAYASGARLIVAATGDPRVNAAVSRDARRRGTLVNVVDAPEECSAIVPSVLRVNPLVITVATQGRFPGLAKKIRRELTPRLRAYAGQVRKLSRLRDLIKKSRLPERQRQQLIRRLLSSRVMAAVEKGHIRTLRDLTGKRQTGKAGTR